MEYWNGKTVKLASGVVAAFSTIVGAAFFIDDRYAHASDVKAMNAEQVQAIKENRIETHRAADMLRKQLLEDKIFEITVLPPEKRTGIQRALLDRYSREVQEINNRWKD
jgi:hypothetical protein